MNWNYREELEKFLKFYEEENAAPYFACTKEEAEEYANEILERMQDEWSFMYELAKLIKMMVGEMDSHTRVRFSKSLKLPFKVVLKGNELVVVDTPKAFREFTGKRITAINKVNVDNLYKEIERIVVFSTNGWRKQRIGEMLSDECSWRMLPSNRNNLDNKITYDFDDTTKFTGKIGEVWFEGEEKKIGYVMNENALIFDYHRCWEKYDGEIARWIDKMMNNDLKKAKRIIVDLRQNQGGSDGLILPLIQILRNVDTEKIALVDRGVFSAGSSAAYELKKIGAKIVGEKIGTTLNHFANNKKTELLDGKIIASVAPDYLYIDEEGNYKVARGQEEFKKLNKKYLEPMYLEIDKKIEGESLIRRNDYLKSLQ